MYTAVAHTIIYQTALSRSDFCRSRLAMLEVPAQRFRRRIFRRFVLINDSCRVRPRVYVFDG